MSSIKVKFRPSALADQEGSIFYQVIHNRKVCSLFPGYHVFPAEWNEKRATVTATKDGGRKPVIRSIHERIRRDVERLVKIDSKLESIGIEYTADDIIDEFNRYSHEYSLFNYAENIIATLKHNGNIRTAETYRSTLNSFKKFRNDEDIMLDCITSETMEAYEAWHKNRGVAPNTISFYTRILRAIYNRAVEDEVIENRHPFRHVSTRIEKTVKRALPLDTVRDIYKLNLSLCPKLAYARDMFMMSFFLRGMSFIDMAFLRKSDLSNGVVTYRRRKTGQRLIIEWTKEMQTILDSYPDCETPYLLPIIRRPVGNERRAYRNAAYNINRNLKLIGKMLGLSIPLTLYVARHSWASAAKAKGIPLSVISEGMGHDSETTTQIYLASLDTTVVDRANSVILKSLK